MSNSDETANAINHVGRALRPAGFIVTATSITIGRAQRKYIYIYVYL